MEPQAVSNWARRHDATFPRPSIQGETELYPVEAVATWLDQRKIPRNRRGPYEDPGVTFGQRFRRNLGMAPAPTDPPAHSTENTWQKDFWQSLEFLWGTSGTVRYLDIILVLLAVRRFSPATWRTLLEPPASTRDLSKVLAARSRENPGRAGMYGPAMVLLDNDPDLAATLKKLLRILHQVTAATTGAVQAPDATAVADFLLDRLSGLDRLTPEEFFTPPAVASIAMKILDPRPGERIHDPCCGAGELLVAAARHARLRGGLPMLHGFARSRRSWQVTHLHAAVHGLVADLGPQMRALRDQLDLPDRYDVVVTNPPFNEPVWASGETTDHPRFPYGAPPAHNANFAWLQSAVSALRAGGRAAVIMPSSAATSSRGSEEEHVRGRLVHAGVLECVVALPGDLFRGAASPEIGMWILRSPGSETPRDDMLFIDGRSIGTKIGTAERYLTEDDADRVASTYHRWRTSGSLHATDDRDFAAAVRRERVVRRPGIRLTPGSYVHLPPAPVDLARTRADLRTLTAELEHRHEQALAADHAVNRIMTEVARWTA
ncbi:class I SAM-dependent DNA methyltransferase [Frankia sp. AgPm24]|uniref:HsdM family class I SAM-dependent methyltransferase n=1 Tax=Frankia sp. AgPm24 TaxID=631128 RepID=UPI00200F66BB|nr:N-6 DNA methylase [Frankia sp. AgPm24]